MTAVSQGKTLSRDVTGRTMAGSGHVQTGHVPPQSAQFADKLHDTFSGPVDTAGPDQTDWSGSPWPDDHF